MTLYLTAGLVAYLCFALAAIGDKVILSRHINHPVAYAFYIGIFSPIALLLAPLGLHWLPWQTLLLALLGGMCFVYALIFFYRAINQSNPSRVSTMIGGLEPIFILILAYLLAHERLNSSQFIAYALLLSGSVLISFEKVAGKWTARALLNAVIAAFLFGLSFALLKYTYNHTNFISGLIWTKIGLFLGAASFLLHPSTRKVILSPHWNDLKRGKFVFLGNFALGSVGTLLQNYAISLGSVSLISSLQGVQFVFLLILGLIFTKHFPKLLKEETSGKIIAQKVLAIILIALGLFLVNLKFQPAEKQVWGLNFSQVRARELGFDPKQMYLDMLSDLRPKKIRLMAYWDEIEPRSDEYDFSEMDQMLKLAEDYHAEVILAIGKKLPRWPECHEPGWVNTLSESDQQQAELQMLQASVNHFKTFPAIKIWQVENEPLFRFGDNCPTIPRNFLKQEISLVKSLDSRPVMVTDSGELGLWLPVATTGPDLFGSTMYRVVHNPHFGYYKFPLPPFFFHIKAGLLQMFTKLPPPIGVELQAEPWFTNGYQNSPLDEQKTLMNPKVFAQNIEYARKAGFEDNYLWGVEWWYWMAKKNGDWGMWAAAKDLLK